MKILQINATWAGGGPGGVVKDIYTLLQERGDECFVAYGRGCAGNGINSYRVGNRLDNYLQVLSARMFDNAGFSLGAGTGKLIEYIKCLKPDIIHLHNLLGYYINVQLLFDYLKGTKIPVVWTIHDCWAFTGHCINFERVDCKKWIDGCNSCELHNDYPQSPYADCSKKNYIKKANVFSGVDNMRLVTPSEWLYRLVSKSFLNNYPIDVINNGIDIELFNNKDSDLRRKYNINDKKLLLFTASSWNEMKGERIVYSLCERLDDSFAVVMIGSKSQNNTSNRIINIPRIKNAAELVQWYSAADLLVNPTLGDNFPTVNIEALACSTPVVTFDTGGCSEVINDECGVLVSDKTADGLIKAIDHCLAKNISPQKCRDVALKYDRKIFFEKYLRLYDLLLNS